MVRTILGSSLFGLCMNDAQSHESLEYWSEQGFTDVDCALMYANGESEKVIGRLKLCQDHSKIKVATKANPLQGFKAKEVVNQLNISLTSLKLDFVDIFYLHFANRKIPIEETLKGVDQLYKEGKFKEFGLSNYSASEVSEIYDICNGKGYVLPTVYEGMYSAITRSVEEDLFSVLRKLGIRFYAYSALAMGMLSGKYNFDEEDEKQPRGQLFTDLESLKPVSTIIRKVYWKSNFKAAVRIIQEALDAVYGGEVPLYDAAIRWLVHHSKLSRDDGIIIGGSKLEHFQTGVKALNGDPLHENIARAFEDAWEIAKVDCPKYYCAFDDALYAIGDNVFPE